MLPAPNITLLMLSSPLPASQPQHQHQLSYHSIILALLPIGLNTMVRSPTLQASLLGFDSRYCFYRYASPFICAADVLDFLLSCTIHSWKMKSVRAGMYGAMRRRGVKAEKATNSATEKIRLSKKAASETIRMKEPRSRLLEVVTARTRTVLALVASAQVVKLLVCSGIPWTHLWAACYFSSWLFWEAVLRIAPWALSSDDNDREDIDTGCSIPFASALVDMLQRLGFIAQLIALIWTTYKLLYRRVVFSPEVFPLDAVSHAYSESESGLGVWAWIVMSATTLGMLLVFMLMIWAQIVLQLLGPLLPLAIYVEWATRSNPRRQHRYHAQRLWISLGCLAVLLPVSVAVWYVVLVEPWLTRWINFQMAIAPWTTAAMVFISVAAGGYWVARWFVSKEGWVRMRLQKLEWNVVPKVEEIALGYYVFAAVTVAGALTGYIVGYDGSGTYRPGWTSWLG
jgi:hypothetical protein